MDFVIPLKPKLFRMLDLSAFEARRHLIAKAGGQHEPSNDGVSVRLVIVKVGNSERYPRWPSMSSSPLVSFPFNRFYTLPALSRFIECFNFLALKARHIDFDWISNG